MQSTSRVQLVQLLLFGAALYAVSVALPPYWTGLLTEALIWSLFALSLDILLGHAGLPSLGHAAFYGMGGYAAAIGFLKAGCGFWFSLALGVGAAALLALVFGLLALRTTGVYFLMITLALAQILWGVAYSWRSLTNGDDGLRSITRETTEFLGLHFGVTGDYFLFVLAVFLLAAAAILVLLRSPFGQALRGVRESTERMEALGYNTWLYKLLAFVIAGALAGLAGVLFVFNKNYISPEAAGIVMSAEVMLMIILGGAGTLFGPVIGAFAIVFLSYLVAELTERWTLILGAIYVLVVLLAPRGVTGLYEDFRLRRKRRSAI